MEVETHQMVTEERSTKSAMENVSTTTEAPQTAEAVSSPPKQMILYYEWQKQHHLWLNSLMWQAIGEKDGPKILDLSNLQYPVRLDPEHHANFEPMHPFICCYDLRIVVAEAKDPVEVYCQALTKWFNKILEIDEDAVIYPWTAVDCQAGTTVIEDLDKLPTTFSNLKKYTPKVWLWLKGGTLYLKILVGMEHNPNTVVEDISWWLKSTTQGMWPAQLQDAEETTSLRWLLFSTDEMDKEALHKEIWQMTGVQVAIQL